MQLLPLFLGFLIAGFMLTTSHAQPPVEFYKGKTIDIFTPSDFATAIRRLSRR